MTQRKRKENREKTKRNAVRCSEPERCRSPQLYSANVFYLTLGAYLIFFLFLFLSWGEKNAELFKEMRADEGYTFVTTPDHTSPHQTTPRHTTQRLTPFALHSALLATPSDGTRKAETSQAFNVKRYERRATPTDATRYFSRLPMSNATRRHM